MKGRLLLDIAAHAFKACSTSVEEIDLLVAQGAAVFELLASEDETLLVGWDSFFVLDLGLDIIDSVRGLDLEGDGLSGESLNEDLHAEVWMELVEEVVVTDRGGWRRQGGAKGDFISSNSNSARCHPAVAHGGPGRSGLSHGRTVLE